jgi:hypothetical protein
MIISVVPQKHRCVVRWIDSSGFTHEIALEYTPASCVCAYTPFVRGDELHMITDTGRLFVYGRHGIDELRVDGTRVTMGPKYCAVGYMNTHPVKKINDDTFVQDSKW